MRSSKMAGQGRPQSFHRRSKPSFITAAVALGLLTNLFFYGIMVPVLPFMLRDRLCIPGSQTQSYASGLITVYAGPSVLFSLPAGCVADKIGSRQPPFVAGLLMQMPVNTAPSFWQRAAIVIIARLVQGLAAAVVWTTGLAMVKDTTYPRNMGKVVGMLCHGQSRRSYQEKAS